MTVAPGQTVEVTDRLFAGAKVVTLLDQYRDEYSIPLFDRAVDFGWFYFLTKPIFYVLHWIHGVVRQLRHRHPDPDASGQGSRSSRSPTSPIGPWRR